MRFGHGLAIGAVLGALVTWLAMARPWRSSEEPAAAAPPPDAAPAATASVKKKKRGKRGEAGESEAPAPVLSAADREPVWRGPAISLPTRSVDLGSDEDARPLDSGEIDQVLSRSSEPVLSCIKQALAGAELTGKVELEMLVSGTGAVQKVRVRAARWLLEHGLADCASAAARRVRFPATGAPTIVNAPYHLD
jgi:hypothetical protein